jgi:hypothetical protein
MRTVDGSWKVGGGVSGSVGEGSSIGEPQATLAVDGNDDDVKCNGIFAVGQAGGGVDDAAAGVDGFAGLWMRLPQGQHLAGRFVAHPSQDTVNEND